MKQNTAAVTGEVLERARAIVATIQESAAAENRFLTADDQRRADRELAEIGMKLTEYGDLSPTEIDPNQKDK